MFVRSICCALLVVAVGGCRPDSDSQGDADQAPDVSKEVDKGSTKPPLKVKKAHQPPPPEMVDPVPFWEGGKTTRKVDAAAAALHGYLVLDLGEAWTPYLFTEAEDGEGNLLTNHYRKTYLQLARGEWPKNHHGERAERDKYLELYGIMPTLSVLRERFRKIQALPCRHDLDLTPLQEFSGVVSYQSNTEARRRAREFSYLQNQVKVLMRRQGVQTPEELDLKRIRKRRERDILIRFRRRGPAARAVRAVQDRLKCEGFYKGRGRYMKGALDWVTHEALAEFERRHRIYSWGYIGRDSMKVLRIDPMEAEARGVMRVLAERAIHSSGILEDGSLGTKPDGSARTFIGADGKEHPIPNLVEQVEAGIVDAFGLHSPEQTLAFLESLGELKQGEHRFVAIKGPELPEYYDGTMELTLRYDRGDVWYDFPFGTEGQQKRQPVQRRPRVTVLTKYLDRWIPLARFGTTIGGWRSELIEGHVMWKYKNSPVGPRVWQRIVASPVWLPPDSTPHRELLKRRRKRKPGEPLLEVNYHETGPSYASAYGLVAAYHSKFMRKRDGTMAIGGDEGIRTHGSVDYMSIMRRHSHGCHRLHNHIAVRLMSFVLAHRPHRRVGQQPLSFHKVLEHEDQTYPLDITVGGYIFELEEPLVVNVLEGRVRGKLKEPLGIPVPKYDENLQAYLMPDGRAVELRGRELFEVPLPMPETDAGVPMPSGLEEFLTGTLNAPGVVAPAPPEPPPGL